MKIAIFLDVDKTVTQLNIQEVYARELDQKRAYDDIEKAFQEKTITSTEFGRRIILLFAEKKFSILRAKDFFEKVKLRDGVDKLFSLQSRGVDIYFVSSGPNYYVQPLGELYGVPSKNILSSDYKFGTDGIINSCIAVDDQKKVRFVVDNIKRYDITIGIGDNDRHDRFVDACTISMFMEPNEDYIHVPHFNAVYTLVESLLNQSIIRTPARGPGKKIFLCHNSKDKEAVRTLNKAITMYKVNTWFDEEQIKAGDSWVEKLQSVIAEINACLVIVGDSGVGPWQQKEENAFIIELVKRNCKVIPVIVGTPASIPTLPVFLQQLQYVDLRGANLYEFVKLISALEEYIPT